MTFSGIIEVLALPERREEVDPNWDYRAPQGISIGIEVEDVDGLYGRAVDHDLPIKAALGNQPWGHRSLILTDPNGIAINFFTDVHEEVQ